MQEATVKWHDGLTFTGTANTGFEVPLGASPKVGGDNDGFRPLELMAVSLAGCTAMDVISILRKKRQEVTDYEVTVKYQRAEEHPKVITRAHIEYHVTGKGVQKKAVVRAIELSAVRYCPAQAMLSKILPVELEYFIYEEQSEGENELVTRDFYEVPPLE
jgi:putative redox protein